VGVDAGRSESSDRARCNIRHRLNRRRGPSGNGNGDPPGQALQAAGQSTLERRIDECETAAAFDDGPRLQPCLERASMIGEAVLAKLGDLDPGMGGDRPAAGREAFPRACRLVESADPAEQTGTVDEDPFLGPRRVEPCRGDG
jgi:hypothetical protein